MREGQHVNKSPLRPDVGRTLHQVSFDRDNAIQDHVILAFTLSSGPFSSSRLFRFVNRGRIFMMKPLYSPYISICRGFFSAGEEEAARVFSSFFL